MTSLLHDIRHAASPKTEMDQQVMELDQCRGGYLRCAKLQPRAYGRVEHPTRYDHNDTRTDFDVDDFAIRPLLAVLPSQVPAVQRVPAIVDDHLCPDMGRMSP